MPKKKEKWKKIPHFSDYEVSNLGRIRSLKGKKKKLMKIREGADGYPRITLQRDDGQKTVCKIHNLVASAFLGSPNGRLVRHKDGDKSNPNLSNLAYGTTMENHEDKYEHGTHQMGEQNSRALLTKDEVLDIYDNPEGLTQQELADYYGMSRQAISDIQRGQTWTEITHAK